jgi:adenine deaminase
LINIPFYKSNILTLGIDTNENMKQVYTGNTVNLFDFTISYGTILVENERILEIEYLGNEQTGQHYFMPGFVDAHVHIESSMLTPSNFARMAVVHGTVGTVSDPHEIANVLGIAGVEFMLEDAKKVPFKFCFGAPSCVPATIFETAGASISSQEIFELLSKKEIGYLAEMMNYPGVLFDDEEVMEKIKIAKAINKPIDGHAPGLRGASLMKYVSAGISTDHECFTEDEAAEKLKLGMKILIREGSAAKNFEALSSLIDQNYEKMMFCSDDKHPDSLVLGHINELVKRAIAKGNDVFKVLSMACLNPVLHYRMNIGLLREGDFADFIEVSDLENFEVLATYLNGQKVAENGRTLIENVIPVIVNQFDCEPKTASDFKIISDENLINVIEVIDGQLITNNAEMLSKQFGSEHIVDLERDILKIAVINRYHEAPIAKAFVKNFGLKQGAIASSVAHDSHNIIVVGVDDESMAEAVNLIIQSKGGISAVSLTQRGILPLPIAGIISDKDGYEVAKDYSQIDAFAKDALGCKLISPFMSLSFMALLVIPALKLSDKGLFDGEKFEFL